MMKYYCYDIMEGVPARYKMIIGKKAIGKTYGALKKIIINYYGRREQGALIMRWKDVFIWKRGYAMFESLVDNGEITKITHGAWTDVYYHSGRWYLCRYEDDNRITDDTPFCYGFTLEGVENEKLTSELTHISLIVFDDFIESSVYLKNEFLIFISVLAHVMRHTCKRNHIVIYMLGNPKNKNCPYFNEMGLYHVTDMKPGSLDLYLYSANGGSNIAVEFCGDGEPTIIQYHKPYRRCK